VNDRSQQCECREAINWLVLDRLDQIFDCCAPGMQPERKSWCCCCSARAQSTAVWRKAAAPSSVRDELPHTDTTAVRPTTSQLLLVLVQSLTRRIG
jgi:hypothetical protein